jgi:hypothetical protein
VDENGELVYEEVPVLDEYGQPVFDEEGNPIMESKVVIDYETKQEIEQTFNEKEIKCSDETFEANYAIALKEAYNGEVTVEEVDDPETPAPSGGDSSVWDELDAAYQEGVDSV